ncbi:hypothetical protein [Herbiconiux sp.]|uniref:hypothetical protein n=1 Tax=Herbiconiux sp. TaxID=1871186 RepID=UPI0025C1397D|nr:hypothetical protein [Herbiconiux sp.]
MSETEPLQEPADPQSADRHPAVATRQRITGVLLIGMCVVVWWPAFTIGAWGEPFFDQALGVWAASTAALIVVLLERRRRGGRKVWRVLALLTPTLWLVLSFVVQDASDDAVLAVAVIGVVVAVLALPTAIWVLARMVWPELGETTWKERLIVLGAVGFIAVASFLLGANHSRFLTCEDFSLSGNSEPPGCTPADE